ncbi:MAG: 16S rRNA (cytidine(1402)-2'-O)-methyltransferase [Magnetococcales bacterium]|nr:16S rRNA (cytidine(1402)-2'-O)-methyltransferase [Magnetococcales bacterium]MBF0323131.1 16S rRNA (cytidine(1402)-2'-O)-methyltransferase [Magnetococcales bacterium]
MNAIAKRDDPATITSVSIHCKGHLNIQATHTKTLELTTDLDVTQRGSCIVGVAAQYDADALASLRGPVCITLRCGEQIDTLFAVVSPTFKPGDPLIIRRHPLPQGNTFAHAATKSARDLDRAFIDSLRLPGANVVMDVEPVRLPEATTIQGILYVVSLPIGNSLDLSPRAQATLAGVDRILAEDTRTADALLKSLGIRKPLISCHDQNEEERAAQMETWLQRGERLALISEAGTPGCADPGYPVVRRAVQLGALVSPVPGPSAILAALAISGLPSDRFLFLGFLPRTRGKRLLLLQEIALASTTTVVFETPHRLLETLDDLLATLPERDMVITCNLTRPNEIVVRGQADTLRQHFRDQDAVRGEFTLVIGKAPPRQENATGEEQDRLLTELLRSGCPLKTLSQALAVTQGIPRRQAFERLLALKGATRSSSDAEFDDQDLS